MKKIYMLGIGGISMSVLAMMLKEFGYDVSGSDDMRSRATEELQACGIDVDYVANYSKIREADEVVYSSAIKPDNPQFLFALNCRKKLVTRGQILGRVSKKYSKVIAVAGSHGKTTTTAMLYEILLAAGLSPSLHLGGYRIEDGKNYVLAGKDVFITEACEYCDNFLNLFPYLSVVTNIEKEHMDYFKTFENQKCSYEKFKKQSRNVIDGMGEFCAKNLRHDAQGNLAFSLYKGKEKVMRIKLKICEEVNVENCIIAYRAAKLLGIDDCTIKLALEKFKGVEMRFQRVKSRYCENVILDYAHHPTEILKAIKSVKKIYKTKNIRIIFQPHTFSRTKSLIREFVGVFKNENVLFFKTYSAREKPNDGLSARQLSVRVEKFNKKAMYFDEYNLLEEKLKQCDAKNDLLLFVGAGDLPIKLNKSRFIE